MKKASNRKARYYRYAAIALLIALLVAAGLFCLQLWENKQDGYSSESEFEIDDAVIEYDGKKYEPKENIETVLLLGLDKFDSASAESPEASYNNDKQADFLLLLVLDNNSKTCSVVQINRDTMASVQVLDVAGNSIGSETKQIALAHTYGDGREVSCRNTADAVSYLLHGMSIDHYVSLTMDSVPIYNDLLGGVEVEVLDDFGGIDSALVKGERVTLKGQQALTYVRARQGMEDSSNLARMKRQRQYLSALADKSMARSKADGEFVFNAVLEMSEYIVSNQTVAQLQELFEKLTTYKYSSIIQMEGKTEIKDGYNCFYPDSQAVEQLVIDLFYKVKA